MPRSQRAAILVLWSAGAIAAGCSRTHGAQPEPDAGAFTSQAGSPAPIAEAGYMRSLAETECGLFTRCCEQAGLAAPGDSCAQGLEAVLAPHSPDAATGARYDPDAAARCIAELARAGCGSAKGVRDLPSACDATYVRGRLQPGERCQSDYECAPDDAGRTTTCSLELKADEWQQVCRIIELRAEGEPCTEVASEPHVWVTCDASSFCDEARGVCVGRAEPGEACLTGPSYGDTCAPGSVCDREGSARCVAPAAVGHACEPQHNLCEAGACIAGKCRLPLAWLAPGSCGQ